MLVLRRKAGEAIVLNGTITIHVLAVEGERVKLGINAPADVVIVRSELLEGQSAGPGASLPGTPIPTREHRSYVARDADVQRPYRESENGNSSGEITTPGRTPGNGMYSTPVRYTPRRRMYDDPTAPAPMPKANPRYR
jgi:carbon storage regulator